MNKVVKKSDSDVKPLIYSVQNGEVRYSKFIVKYASLVTFSV